MLHSQYSTILNESYKNKEFQRALLFCAFREEIRSTGSTNDALIHRPCKLPSPEFTFSQDNNKRLETAGKYIDAALVFVFFSLCSPNQNLVVNQKTFHTPKLLAQVLISMTS